MRRVLPAITAMALVALIALAGCGGGDDGETARQEQGSVGGQTGAAAGGDNSGGGSVTVIDSTESGDLGTILVDSSGFAVYDFHRDRNGVSSCYGACAQLWPPVTTEGMPRAEGAAVASKLGTTKRKDGTVQVTYAGWPLYNYSADTRPGEAAGNDIDEFGAEWYALAPSGEEPEGGEEPEAKGAY